MSAVADKNLLFGIVALQMDFIGRDALLAGMHAWVADKGKPLGQILLDQKVLSGQHYALLEALVDAHIKQHGDDPQRSLLAISSMQSVRVELGHIADSDVQASLANVHADRSAAQQGEPQRTIPLSAATSSGKRFRVLRPWREGGLGKVSVAQDEELHREVALKEIKYQHARNPASRERFLLEAEITGALEHPGIVPVYGLGNYGDGRPFYAMRFVRGDSLEEAIERYHKPNSQREAGKGVVAFRELLGRFIDVCNAVAYAHSRGVLHRDLKPGNIILGKYGETLVVDWGLAKIAGKSDEPAAAFEETPLEIHAKSGSAPTRMGALIGTPAFMSPEQAEGRLDLLGPASDVYSLGATLYAVLTGIAPFTDRDVENVLAKVRTGEFPPPKTLNAQLELPLEAICLKAMSLKSADRYSSPTYLADDLERWLADEPVAAYRESFVARVRRWGRRHRAIVTGSSVLLISTTLALAIGTLLIGYQKAEADRQRQLAVEAKNESDGKNKELQKQLVLNFLERANAEHIHGRCDVGLALLSRAYDLCSADDSLRRTLTELISSWTLDSPRILLICDSGFPSTISAMTYSPDGLQIVALCRGVAKVYDAISGKELKSFSDPHGIRSAAFSPNGQLLAIVGQDFRVRLWDIKSGKQLRQVSGTQVVFSPDGNQLLTVNEDNSIRLWDATNAKEVRRFAGGDSGRESINSVAFSNDGRQILAGGSSNHAKLWDVATGEKLLSLSGDMSQQNYDIQIRSVAFCPDGRRILTAGDEGIVRVWDRANGAQLKRLKNTGHDITAAVFSSDGEQVITFGYHHISILDADSGDIIQSRLNDAISMAVSPDSRFVAWAGVPGVIQVCNIGISKEVRRTPLLRPTYSVDFSPDGRRIVSAGFPLRVWDTRTGEELGAFEPIAYGVETAQYSADGRLIVGEGGRDSSVYVYDADSGKLLHQLPHAPYCAITPDSRKILTLDTSGPERDIRLWDSSTGQELGQVKLQDPRRVIRIQFSHDGRQVLATGDDVTRFIDLESGKETVRLEGSSGGNGMRVSCDGKFVVGASDGWVWMWDTSSGAKIRRLGRQQGTVWKIATTSDSRQVLIATNDSVQVWDTATGIELECFEGFQGSISGASISPGGKQIVASLTRRTSSTNQLAQLRLWNRFDVLPNEPQSLSQWVMFYTGLRARNDGIVERLTAEEWAKNRDFVFAKGGDWTGHLTSSNAQLCAWHTARASDAEEAGHWFAAAYHLNWLIERSSNESAELIIRRDRAAEELSKMDLKVGLLQSE